MEIKLKKTKKLLFLCAALIFCSAGCKNQNATPEKQREPDAFGTDWKSNGLAVSEEVKVNETYYLNSFDKWEHFLDTDDKEEPAVIETGGNGRYSWFLGVRRNENGEYERGENAVYILDVYCSDASSASGGNDAVNTKSIKFTPMDIGADGEIGYIVSADVLGENSYMFRWAEYEFEDEMYCQKSDKIIFTDLKGNNTVNEFYEIFKEQGIEEYGQTILPCWPYGDCHALSTDKIWVSNKFLNEKFCIFSQQGELILERKERENQMFYEPVVTVDGELILPVYNNNMGKIYFFFAELSNGSWKQIGEMNALPGDIKQFYAIVDKYIYYQANNPQTISENGIVRWDIETGDRTWILKYNVSGLAQYDTKAAFSENKPVCVFLGRSDDSGFKNYLVSVSEEKLQRDDDIVVADLVGSCSQAEKAAVNASMESPDCQYKYVDVSSKEEKDRIMAELSNKKGPQIMYVSMDDYYKMLEKNMLCDWYSLTDKSFFADVLPAVLELGTRGNSLYGLPVGIRVESMAAGQQPEESDWTIDAIVKLMSEGKINTSLRTPYIFDKDYLEPDFVVNSLTKCVLNNSFLIDWNKKTAHFDDDSFIKLLELTREDISSIPAADTYENDLIWAYLNNYPDVMDYLSKDAVDYTIMGFPNHDITGNYIMPARNGMLVINSNISNTEKIVLFIQKLLDNQIQLDTTNFCLGIKKMKAQDFVRTDASGNKIYMNVYNTGEYSEERILSLFDKTAAFLESCEPVPQQYGVINSIILEELSSMRSSNKGARETAGIINDRVEIYLQEND